MKKKKKKTGCDRIVKAFEGMSKCKLCDDTAQMFGVLFGQAQLQPVNECYQFKCSNANKIREMIDNNK